MNIASSSLSTITTFALFAGIAACLSGCSNTKPKQAAPKQNQPAGQAMVNQAAGLVITALNQTIEICDIQPGTYQPTGCVTRCAAVPVNQNEPAACEVVAPTPKVVRVTRGTAPTDAGYLLYMGPINGTQGKVLVDTYDTPVFTNEQRLASSSLVSGWSMSLRNRPYPPGRSGRFTSGRPRFFPGIFISGPQQVFPVPLTDVYPATCMPLHQSETYATLSIVKPGSNETAGECWVMTRDMAEDDRLAIFAHDGTTVDLSKFVCITHETYAIFTWDAGNPTGSWSSVQPLPSLGWLQTNKPFAHTAINACYQYSGKRFFAQDD